MVRVSNVKVIMHFGHSAEFQVIHTFKATRIIVSTENLSGIYGVTEPNGGPPVAAATPRWS